MRLACLGLLLVALLLPSTVCGAGLDYLRDIKPIFRERCFACHGALKQQSGLRLDTGAAIRQGGDSGAAVAAGNAAKSLLIERITSNDASLRMPPEGKPLSAEEIAGIRTWIDQGASSPADEGAEEDPRLHWAFQPIARPAVPLDSPSGHPIDAFLEARLREQGFTARPAEQRSILLRRVYLDLIGLPPTREELHAFLADESSDAYGRVVERLLADPRYGERWGRHWMDIWRYSDWYGRRHVPDVWNSAPQIWRWRDWIVQSLNQDLGYDAMVRRMLAADELRPEDDEAAVATGYLIRNWYALNPNDWMRNTVEHTGKAFLGLTFNCAHCHDHKYDPISQDDYFRLRAFFEPMHVRQDRVAGEADPGAFQEYEYSKLRKIQRLGAVQIFDKNPAAPTYFYTGGDERNRVTERGSIAPGVPAFLAAGLPPIEPIAMPPQFWYPGLRPEIQATLLDECKAAVASAAKDLAAASQPADKAPAQARLLAARSDLASAEARIAADRARYGQSNSVDVAALSVAAHRLQLVAALHRVELEVAISEQKLVAAEARPADDAKRAKEIEAAKKQLAASHTARDKARETLANAAASEAYAPLSPIYPKSSSGRRRALALWITSPQNPLTARVAVNHIWARHFHAPLVATVNNFGRSGARPTHPKLLDWLAAELMESGWSMKHLHRQIVHSDAYRRVSSVGDQQHEAIQDPENKLLWRMNTGRMEAEVVRDSLLYVAGRLDFRHGGQELENSESMKTTRRSLYYSVHPENEGKSAVGQLFDGPDALDCYRRTRSIVPQQALVLTNSDLVHQTSSEIARTCQEREPAPFVIALFEQLLGRAPTENEQRLCLDALNQQTALLTQSHAADAPMRARESLVRALLNHNDFVTIR